MARNTKILRQLGALLKYCVAVSDEPDGPFTATDHFGFDFDDGSGKKVSAEDPYVWYHKKDKCFYAIV